MPLDEDVFVKTKDQIVSLMMAEFQTAIPDVWLGEDGYLRMLLEVTGGQFESIYVANQILREDMFLQTASVAALDLYGDQFGVSRKAGAQAVGELLFSGAGGTYIPVAAEVSYDPGTGEENILIYETLEDGTIPNPGTPTAPTLALGAAGNPNGTYEYAVSFVTAAGETLIGAVSNTIVATSDIINLSAIPTGGAGTTARRIYRRLVGGVFKRVTTINDNSTTVYADNATDASISGNPEPLSVSTAHAILLDGSAEEAGVDYNVVSNSIIHLNDVPDGVTGVTNPGAFTGGTDEEDSEAYRVRLLSAIRAPATGSKADLESWAEEIEGVEDATAFHNDNLGTPTNGHVTVRISGPGGTVPGAPVIAEVLAHLESKDIANITIHVTTFTAVPTNVTVTLTLETGYILADVSPSVDAAIRTYINDLGVAQTFRRNELIAALIPLPGVLDLVVNTPASDQTTAATEKRTPGTITVN